MPESFAKGKRGDMFAPKSSFREVKGTARIPAIYETTAL
jgi:hypothetical protein